MKRKAGLFLLAVMVAVSLGAIIVTSLAMYRLASQRYAEEIRKIEASLSDRFAVFQSMLSDQHGASRRTWKRCCRRSRQELESDGPGARRPVDRRADGAGARHGVQHIYFIDRSHIRLPDQLPRRHEPRLSPRAPFTEFLDLVFGGNQVMNDGIDLRRSPERSGPTATSAPREKTTSSRPRPTSATASTRPLGWMASSSSRTCSPTRSAQSVRQGTSTSI